MNESLIPGLYGIDTRKLTKIIRDKGTMKAKIVFDEEKPTFTIPNNDLVSLVSRKDIKNTILTVNIKLLLLIVGIKNNIIRKLLTTLIYILK